MSNELIVVILLIPCYICLAYILKKISTYANGYSKGFNDAKRFYERHNESGDKEWYLESAL